jgi:predicted outer membrane repeat protein
MRYLHRIALVMGIFLSLHMVALPARAADATVLVCDFATLSAAVATANAGGGTITFACSGTITFTGELFISDTVIIEGGAGITFDGGGTTRLFSVGGGSSLTLNNATLQNGVATEGGAVYVSGTFTANTVTFVTNMATASNGGAIRNLGTTTISNSIFTNNTSNLGGGAIYNDNTITITNSQFIGNSSGSGGAIYNFNNMNITGSDFQANFANIGGAIFTDNIGSVVNSTFANNYTTFGNGGAIQQNGTYLLVDGSTFTNNSAFDRGGAIRSSGGPVDLENSIFLNNSANISGGSLHVQTGLFTIENTHFENGDCVAVLDTFTDNGGNTALSATGCPGTAPVALSVSGLSCNGDNAQFTINSGDGTFSITDTTAGVSIANSPAGLITLTGPATWTDVTVAELGGERQMQGIGGITCPSGVIIPPTIPPAPSATVTVLGCALDVTDGVDVANAPDNTYCRILMKNGGVVSYSGAVPADLIGLGVILAVDVYRLEGGASQNTFPNYAQICLAGQGRLFYMDSRNAPRVSIELATEILGGATCGWIPAPGTLILTN